MRIIVALTVILACSTARTFGAATGSDDGECTIFMAPSSMKGVNSFGLYTTRDISKGESILSGPDSPSIPVLDFDNHRTKEVDQWIKLFDEYWWGRGKPGKSGKQCFYYADCTLTLSFPERCQIM